MEHNPGPEARIRGLEADASQVMRELAELSAQLKDVARDQVGELSKDAAAQLDEQLKGLQARVQALGADSQQLLATVDKSVRANPYLYIAGALGLGVLLGKALRS
jgi:ElaB/YqjD/DUF883 family membrane-anchored ribosome-binding protein